MTEQEYIDVTDLVKLRDIKFILRDIIPENSEIIDKDSFNSIYAIIGEWEHKLSNKIMIKG